MHNRIQEERPRGLEPLTTSLESSCSTAELRARVFPTGLVTSISVLNGRNPDLDDRNANEGAPQ